MLTPAFTLSQDEKFIYIVIKAPYTKISETEIFIEGDEFKFFSKPYFLRLNLPGNIVENEEVSAKYDADDGTFSVNVAKETPGEHFADLDMLTKLLAPKSNITRNNPIIEELDPETHDSYEQYEESEFDWQVDQAPFQEEDILMGEVKYGFANQKSAVFKRLQGEMVDIIDLPNADETLPQDRCAQRKAQEDAKFDEDYYLADLYNADQIEDIIKFQTPWQERHSKYRSNESSDDLVTLSDEENEKMRKLPRRSYLIDDKDLPSVYLGLVDIIFAYAYDYRITEAESNVESNWTISKLSSALSWLQVCHNVREVVKCSMRRILCFPLYRNWDLANAVLKDTQAIFTLGKKQILKCLLSVHSIFSQSDPKYILNDVFITDYCVWIQSASSKQIESLATALGQMKIRKEDMDLGLVELEQAAALVLQEGEDDAASQLADRLADMTVSAYQHSGRSESAGPVTEADSDDDSDDDSETDSADSDDIDSDDDTSEYDCEEEECEQEIVSTYKENCINSEMLDK